MHFVCATLHSKVQVANAKKHSQYRTAYLHAHILIEAGRCTAMELMDVP